METKTMQIVYSKSSSTNWDPHIDFNEYFIVSAIRHCNTLLEHQGYLLLDVLLKHLGIMKGIEPMERCRYGWIFKKKAIVSYITRDPKEDQFVITVEALDLWNEDLWR